MRLENWSVTSVGGEYDPPEYRRIQVQGDVYDHPTRPDGERIRTSDIRSVDGNEVKTRSRSVYTLGNPDEKYVEWCIANGGHVPTPEQPIEMK
jgi:hypothetical protein